MKNYWFTPQYEDLIFVNRRFIRWTHKLRWKIFRNSNNYCKMYEMENSKEIFWFTFVMSSTPKTSSKISILLEFIFLFRFIFFLNYLSFSFPHRRIEINEKFSFLNIFASMRWLWIFVGWTFVATEKFIALLKHR